MSGVQNRIKGAVYILLLYLSSTLGSQFFLIPLLPLLFINTSLCRWGMDLMLAWWKLYAVALYELVFGINLVYSGDSSPTPEGAIILMNHRTRLDWIYLFAYELRYGSLMRGKVILKTSLKHIPGPGWAMQCGLFIFIRRRWEADKISLTQIIHYCRKLAYKPQMLLFPEGTDLTSYTLANSAQYADQHDLPRYQHVLHPRTTGFAFLVESLSAGKLLDGVTDITIAYPDIIAQTEHDALNGKFPNSIHFHIKHYHMEDIPQSKELVEDWCKKLWSHKENVLKKFYSTTKEFSDTPLPDKSSEIRFKLIAALIFWTLFIMVVLYGLIVCFIIRWYIIITIIIFISIAILFGGVDNLQTSLVLDTNVNNNIF